MTALTGFQLVAIRRGDSLQAIAARTLGDATRWSQLVWINGLTYPYLTDDPTQASATVLLSGSLLKVPAAAAPASATTDPDKLFGIDLELVDGDLDVDSSGDLAVVGGLANLQQALEDRLETEPGELVFHLDYGNGALALIGQGNGPSTGLLCNEYVASCLRADPRVASVQSVTAQVQGSAISATAVVNPIVGTPVTISSGT